MVNNHALCRMGEESMAEVQAKMNVWDETVLAVARMRVLALYRLDADRAVARVILRRQAKYSRGIEMVYARQFFENMPRYCLGWDHYRVEFVQEF